MPHYRFKAACEADILLLRQKLSDAEFVMERTGSELEVVIIIDASLERVRHAMQAIPHSKLMIDTLSHALPVERIARTEIGATAAHIQGTVLMGDDPATSIVDAHLTHHKYRNLLVLGASAFPTASPAYPTLTVSALSLWAADHLFG